jgi:DNA/RNA-binding domain of Phe-tRNA-synthetase-like protein
MKFIVEAKVFELFPAACFGVVVASGVDNKMTDFRPAELLQQSIQTVEAKFAMQRAKESFEMAPYREAFVKLGINPNKYMSSIEAMASRIEKKKGFPSINPIVDLGNALSLKYLLPMGAHDLDAASGDIQVRFSHQGDLFTPFGENAAEQLEAGELIYSVGERVKTRRWIWRQSEEGKVTENSRNIFFPIDGFADRNLDRMIAARDELANCLQQIFGASVQIGLVDKEQPALVLTEI